MESRRVRSGWSETHESRFDLKPPRHFLLPAVLLLLCEEPSHGYNLAQRLTDLHFGRVDRPSVYRALAQLERDGLVESSAGPSKAGTERRIYGITEHGQRVLRRWMGVIKEERDGLDAVLRRYMATGTLDAVLAEVEGGWAAATGPAWSAVTATSRPEGRRRPTVTAPVRPESAARRDAAAARPDSGVTRFGLVPDRSVALVEARSTVGPITFGVIGVTGSIEAETRGGIALDSPPSARLEIAVGDLRSGNSLYDAELLRRIDARRYPTVVLELSGCSRSGAPDRYRIDGTITFHGVSRPLQGTVVATLASSDRMVVSGEQVLDIRDFEIASPTVLMLRIYPDVRVQLQIEAEREG